MLEPADISSLSLGPIQACEPSASGLDLAMVQRVVEAVQRSLDTAQTGADVSLDPRHIDGLVLLLRWARANEDSASMAMARDALDAILEDGLPGNGLDGASPRATAAVGAAGPGEAPQLTNHLRLANLYLEGYQATGDDRYAEVVGKALECACAHTEAILRADSAIRTDDSGLACVVCLRAWWAVDQPRLRPMALYLLHRLLELERAHGLRHSYEADGSPGEAALLVDYAWLLHALLDAYDYTESDFYLDEARRTGDEMASRLWDADAMASFDAPCGPADAPSPGEHLKSVDEASLVAHALDRLGRATYDAKHHRMAGAALWAVQAQAETPSAAWGLALYSWLHPAIEVTLSGRCPSLEMARMTLAAAALPYPNLVIKPGLLQSEVDGPAMAEICLDTLCLAPISDPAQLRQAVMEQLGGRQPDTLDDLPVITLLSPPA